MSVVGHDNRRDQGVIEAMSLLDVVESDFLLSDRKLAVLRSERHEICRFSSSPVREMPSRNMDVGD